MTRTRIATGCMVALLAAGSAACNPGSSDLRTAPKAQEITRASFETFGDHVVHFTAQPTTMLAAEVAQAFGIRRGGNRAMLNIAVLHMADGALGRPVAAAVAADATNLLGQVKNVRVRELRDGDAIYYIGEVRVANEEIVAFNISVRPEGVDAPYQLKFRQQFYTD